ncbi:hypothetical protein ANRL4_02886 [Anaerolineae bacterium]|nr:hypothetical protein ANRL4_02886 [Anaerolineae bacterium]
MSDVRDDLFGDDDPQEIPPAPQQRSPRQSEREVRASSEAYARPALPRQSRSDRESRQSRPMPPSNVRQGGYVPPPPDAPTSSARKRRPAPAPAPRTKRDSGFYLPWWSLIIMLVFVGAAAVGAWAVVDSIGGSAPPGGKTPMVVIVTATFTVGPPPSPTALPLPPTSPPPIILATPEPTLTLPPGNFVPGTLVEVIGVGIAGLNIRSGPGIDSVIRFQAPEGSRWLIKSGPQNASGEEWWEVVDPNNQERGGWGARRFFQSVVQ